MAKILLKERKTIDFKASYKFDVPAVYSTERHVHFFPNDTKYSGGRNEIQGVFFDGKWRQDTFYLSDRELNEILKFAHEHHLK